MNSLKKVILIILVVIPLILIIFNMFFDPFCYILIIDTANKNIIKGLISEEDYSIDDTKVIIIDNKPNKYDKVILINSKLSKEEIEINEQSNLLEYSKENGIDVYHTITLINYIYIIVIAIVIFFAKLSENVSLFSKFGSNDD